MLLSATLRYESAYAPVLHWCHRARQVGNRSCPISIVHAVCARVACVGTPQLRDVRDDVSPMSLWRRVDFEPRAILSPATSAPRARPKLQTRHQRSLPAQNLMLRTAMARLRYPGLRVWVTQDVWRCWSCQRRSQFQRYEWQHCYIRQTRMCAAAGQRKGRS